MPLQVNDYSETLPAQHGYCVRVSRRSATDNWGKVLPKVPTWQLEGDSNPWPFGRKAPNLPMSHHAHDNHDNCHDCPNKTIVTSFSKTSSLCFVKADVDAHCVYDLGNSNTARTWNESWSTVASSCLRSHTYIYHKHWLLYRRIIGDNHAAAKHRNRFLVGLETLDAAKWLVIWPTTVDVFR